MLINVCIQVYLYFTISSQSESIVNAASKVLFSGFVFRFKLTDNIFNLKFFWVTSKDYEAKHILAYNDSTHLYTWSEVLLNHVE